MIVQATRIRTDSGAGRLARHVLDKVQDNESITVLRGRRDELAQFVTDAMEAGKRYAIRHWIVNPGQYWTPAQRDRAVAALLDEFGAADRPHMVVAHRKALATGATVEHLHVLVAEVHGGRVLDSRYSKVRQEKLGRMLEAEFGHAPTQGRHNKAVMERLSVERPDLAVMLDSQAQPRSAFTAEARQTAKRKGQDLAQVRDLVRQAWHQSDSRAALLSALAESGFRVSDGETAEIWIVTDGDGTFLGSLDRLARVKKADVVERMEGGGYGRRDERRTADLRGSESRARGDGHHHCHAGGRRGRRLAADQSGGVAGDHRRQSGDYPAGDRRPSRRGSYRIAAARLTVALMPHMGRMARQQRDLALLAEAITDLILRLLGLARYHRSQAVRPEDARMIVAARTVPERQEVGRALFDHADAESAMRWHHSRRPAGMRSMLDGSRRRWRMELERLTDTEQAAAAHLAEARQRLDRARDRHRPAAERETAANRAKNVSDRNAAERLERAAQAVKAGDALAITAVRFGDIDAAVRRCEFEKGAVVELEVELGAPVTLVDFRPASV